MFGKSKLIRTCNHFFLKTGLKKCRILENEAIVQRRSATLKVSILWRYSGFPCDSRYAIRSQADSQLRVGTFYGPDQ